MAAFPCRNVSDTDEAAFPTQLEQLGFSIKWLCWVLSGESRVTLRSPLHVAGHGVKGAGVGVLGSWWSVIGWCPTASGTWLDPWLLLQDLTKQQEQECGQIIAVFFQSILKRMNSCGFLSFLKITLCYSNIPYEIKIPL